MTLEEARAAKRGMRVVITEGPQRYSHGELIRVSSRGHAYVYINGEREPSCVRTVWLELG